MGAHQPPPACPSTHSQGGLKPPRLLITHLRDLRGLTATKTTEPPGAGAQLPTYDPRMTREGGCVQETYLVPPLTRALRRRTQARSQVRATTPQTHLPISNLSYPTDGDTTAPSPILSFSSLQLFLRLSISGPPHPPLPDLSSRTSFSSEPHLKLPTETSYRSSHLSSPHLF